VAPDDAASNYRMAREALLDRVPIAPDRIHRIEAEAADPAAAASAYERILPREADLVILGLGTDGHTASLFPGDDGVRSLRRRVLVVRAPVEPRCRITVTPPFLAAARNVAVLVSGSSKAEALARVFLGAGPVDETPARLVRDRVWFCDAEAAAWLRGRHRVREQGKDRFGGVALVVSAGRTRTAGPEGEDG
jgi:6-phosphogluconolactonase